MWRGGLQRGRGSLRAGGVTAGRGEGSRWSVVRWCPGRALAQGWEEKGCPGCVSPQLAELITSTQLGAYYNASSVYSFG